MHAATMRSRADTHGAQLFERHCASCHGHLALGDGEKVIPALAGQIESYLLHELVDFSELDRDTPEMHRLLARKELNRPQAWRDLAGFLTHLAPGEHAQVGNRSNVMRGAEAYARLCATCHGPAGEGMERGAAPALRSQHYSYLVLQMRSFDTDRRLDVEPLVLDHMTGLSRDDLEGVADFLSRMLPSSAGAEIASSDRGVTPLAYVPGTPAR
jgi:cytochrome c553